MHILMISDVYFPRINGVSTSIMTFRQQLQQQGHRVTLIVPSYPGDDGRWDDEDLIRINSRGVLMDPEDRMMKMKSIIRTVAQRPFSDIDIVHIQTPFVAHYAGLKLAKRFNVPSVISYHTFFEEYLFHYVAWLPKQLMRFAARHFTRSQCLGVDGLVVPSQAMLAVLRQYGVETGAEVIPTGLDEHCFELGDGQAFKEKHGIAAERPTLVHVGRVAHEKNINFLLETLVHIKQQQPDILMIIAGEGPALETLRQQVNSLALADHVCFVGYLERRQELPACYRAGDLFVFASRTETQGLVLLEAMAQGVPVVSTAVMGTGDIVKPEQGALEAQEDHLHFAGQVLKLLEDPLLKQQKSAEAIDFARTWSVPRLTSQLLRFYHSRLQ